MFDWDRHNLAKIKAHGIEQDAEGEPRYVYYGQTKALRLLAVVLTERNKRISVITAYELDAAQKRDYLERRLKGE